MNREQFNYTLLLGGVRLRFRSEIPLEITDADRPFLDDADSADASADIFFQESLIILPHRECGHDLLMRYSRDEKYFYASGRKEAVGDCCTIRYTPDFSEIACYVNERQYPHMIRKIGKVLQLFPVRQFLIRYQAAILHSSRIKICGKAILFTAPSQIGKTTQARLWNKYENAELLSNDRTILRKRGGGFVTYGYPVDGGSPAYCNEEALLGAVVILKQGNENRIERMRMSGALKLLMEQTVSDVWNCEELAEIQSLWLKLMERYPVYQLTCRPDREAVLCLKNRLAKDGVITYGNDD